MNALRISCALAIAIVLGLAEPIAAAQICPLTSPVAGTSTVTVAPNTYYAGNGTATAGSKTVTVGALNTGGAATAIAAGDEILIIEMQDSAIDTADTSAYGSGGTTGRGVTSDNTSGDYEYAIVTAVAGATLTIAGNGTGGGLINTYHNGAATATKGQQTFQVVRVPRFNNVTLNITGSAVAPWNGTSGGIFAIDASGTVTVTGTVNANAAGFRGGGRLSQGGATGAPDAPPFDYVVGGAVGYDGDKGEGTVGTPELTYNGTAVTQATTDTMPGGSAAMGSPGNAGGGGTDADGTANDDNSGGGGGANGGAGGQGGNDWSPNEAGTTAEGTGTANPADHIYNIGGLGGTAFAPAAATRVVLGGGGGAGSINNNTNAPNGGSGGVGGGMILVRAGAVTGGTLSANGGAGVLTLNDGAGGGGAGGTVVVTATGTISGTTASVVGGAGATSNATNATATQKHGPGGGGGGGLVISSSAMTSTLTGGANGTTLTTALSYGAQPGVAGKAITTTLPTAVPGVSSAAECTVDALTIAKSGTTAASPGGLVRYSIVVSNAGPGRADGTTVSDPVPAGIVPQTATCTGVTGSACAAPTIAGQTISDTVTTLPVGGSVTITIDATAPTGTLSNPYVNTAAVAPPATNTDANVKTSSVSTTVTTANGISKTVQNITENEASAGTADNGKPGDTLQYVLTFTNNTGIALQTLSIGDATPANTTFVSAVCGTPPTGVTCAVTSPAVGGTGAVKYTYTSTAATVLAPGATVTFTMRVKIN